MGRSPCCEKSHTNKGAWSKEEDERLIAYVRAHGEGCWRSLPKSAGLSRCGKSCRLRWINYLRPDLKRGNFTEEEDHLIIKLHSYVGNKWSLIASRLPGRTDNEIKNYWNTHIKRKLIDRGLDPQTHRPLNSSTAAPTDIKSENYIYQVPSPLVLKSEPNVTSAGSVLDNENNNSSTTAETLPLVIDQDRSNDCLDLELSIGLGPFRSRSSISACSCWQLGFHTMGRFCKKCEPNKNRDVIENAIFGSSISYNGTSNMLYKMASNCGTFSFV